MILQLSEHPNPTQEVHATGREETVQQHRQTGSGRQTGLPEATAIVAVTGGASDKAAVLIPLRSALQLLITPDPQTNLTKDLRWAVNRRVSEPGHRIPPGRGAIATYLFVQHIVWSNA
jgi:hypothetical protein